MQDNSLEKKQIRLQAFLAHCGLASRRACENIITDGRVSVNGSPARASYEVKVGDVIAITLGAREVRVRVADVRETALKDDAALLYTILPDES